MEMEKRQKGVLAIDFGASSGRAMLGTLEDGKIRLREIHRFSNDPVTVGGVMYWDILRLFYEVKQSLLKAKELGGIRSVAVDTWGVDFGVLDRNGHLTGNPIHYRDKRTCGMLKRGCEQIGAKRFYQITGIQLMEINTVFQLMAWKEQNPEAVESAGTILLMPDLFHYFLCGKKAAEMSIASTTQLMDGREKKWSGEILNGLGIPRRLLPELTESGTILGTISKTICEELGIEPAKVIAVAGHDTQSAMAAVPALEKNFLFLSCGTWSLLGSELDVPIIEEETFRRGITNEIGYGRKTSFLKNMIGLWMIQESRRQWMKEGKLYSFSQLEQMAGEAEPFICFVDPDDPLFVPAGNIPERIREYCSRTGQKIPETEGQIVRCINESLALKYRMAVEEIEQSSGKSYGNIYMVGGGTQSQMLCQMTADACGRIVSAGPQEATALGNAAVQLIALGEISNIDQARAMIHETEKITVYYPENAGLWKKAYQKFQEVVLC